MWGFGMAYGKTTGQWIREWKCNSSSTAKELLRRERQFEKLKAVRVLLRILETKDTDKHEARDALVEIGMPMVVPALRRWGGYRGVDLDNCYGGPLSHPDHPVALFFEGEYRRCRRAGKSGVECPDNVLQKILPLLLSRAQSYKRGHYVNAWKILGCLGPRAKKAVPILKRRVLHRNAEDYWVLFGIEALARMGVKDSQVVEKAIGQLESSKQHIRDSAADVIEEFGPFGRQQLQRHRG